LQPDATPQEAQSPQGNRVCVELAIAPDPALPLSAEQNAVMPYDTRLQIVLMHLLQLALRI
jgi:hypothetical protein